MSSTTVDPYNSNNYSTTNRVIGTNYGSAVFTDKKIIVIWIRMIS